jgi:hypothetical protein
VLLAKAGVTEILQTTRWNMSERSDTAVANTGGRLNLGDLGMAGSNRNRNRFVNATERTLQRFGGTQGHNHGVAPNSVNQSRSHG